MMESVEKGAIGRMQHITARGATLGKHVVWPRHGGAGGEQLVKDAVTFRQCLLDGHFLLFTRLMCQMFILQLPVYA